MTPLSIESSRAGLVKALKKTNFTKQPTEKVHITLESGHLIIVILVFPPLRSSRSTMIWRRKNCGEYFTSTLTIKVRETLFSLFFLYWNHLLNANCITFHYSAPVWSCQLPIGRSAKCGAGHPSRRPIRIWNAVHSRSPGPLRGVDFSL